MTTLALDTSTAQGSVAVVHDGALVYQTSFLSERSHNSQLFAPLAVALEICGKDLDRIVAGLGPGSYTGIRIGIAAAQGLGWSRNVPVFGLPSVIAPHWSAALPAEFVVCGDARRGSYYVAVVADGQLDTGIELHDAAAFTRRRESDPLRPWFTFDDKVPLQLAEIALVKPTAVLLARYAARLRDEDVFLLEERPLEPLYLAGPFVTQPKPRGPAVLH